MLEVFVACVQVTALVVMVRDEEELTTAVG
jgi:hypothetical protein